MQGILKLALSVEHNPVLRYLVEHHAPVHEELLLPPGMGAIKSGGYRQAIATRSKRFREAIR